MARTKGSTNKEAKPVVLTLKPEQRLHMIATLMIEIICEETTCKP